MSALPLDVIAAIAGPHVQASEHELLAGADARASRFLAQRRGVYIQDDHYSEFQALTETANPGRIKRQDARLDAFDGLIDDRSEVHFAVDVACDRWEPEVTAAYYFGLALAASAPIGSVINISARHWYPKLAFSWIWTYIPEFGGYSSIPIPGFMIHRASGSLNCVVGA